MAPFHGKTSITGFSMANRSLLELSCRLFLSLFFVGLPLGIDSKRGVLLLLPVFGIFSFFLLLDHKVDIFYESQTK